MDEGKLRIAAEKGARAKALLDNEMLQEAFVIVEKRYTDTLMETGYEQEKLREHLWHAIQAVRDVKAAISGFVKTGEYSEKQLLNNAPKQTTTFKQRHI